MAIAITDLKWMQSQRLTDNDDGGGRMTGNVVVDGQVNNLLPNLSRTDRTGGKAQLRKMFGHVTTGNTDVYAGATAAVMAPPADPNVNLLLFKTGDPADERSSAAERIERYLGLGVNTGLLLYGDHYQGQMTLTFIAKAEVPLPEVGDTIVLRVMSTSATEYVRISDVSSTYQSFTTFEQAAERNFTRRIITVSIYTALQHDYAGTEASYFPLFPSPAVRIYSSIVADAARYYGISKLTEAAAPNDLTIQVASIFARVVPATESEMPLIDYRATADFDQRVQAGEPYTITRSANSAVQLYEGYFDRQMTPGSVGITLRFGGLIRLQLRDDAAGNLVTYTGATVLSGATVTFAGCDYTTGRVQVQLSASLGSGPWSLEITAAPAGMIIGAPRTTTQEVTLGNRGLVWIKTLSPRPAPGLLTVSYRAQGRWYTLRDTGRGGLTSGIPAEGSGSVDYATGTVAITTGFLPDVGSHIIWGAGSAIEVQRVDGADSQSPAVRIKRTLGFGVAPGAPGDFEVKYFAGGIERTVVDSGAGTLSGDGDGVVYYSTGDFDFVPDFLPDPGSNITVNCKRRVADNYVEDSPTVGGGGVVSIDLGEAVIENTLFIQVPVTILVSGAPARLILNLFDDGAGNLRRYEYNEATGGLSLAAGTCGTVTYGTGELTVDTEIDYTVWTYDPETATWDTSTVATEYRDGEGGIKIEYQVAGASTDETDIAPIGSITGQLIAAPSLKPVADCARLTVGGQVMVDRNGVLLRAIDPANGAGTVCGSISPTGAYVITSWTGGGANSVAVNAALAYYGQSSISRLAFRLPVPTVRQSSFSVRATSIWGVESNAVSDGLGSVAGGTITGSIDYNHAFAELNFGAPTLPGSVLYNAVGIRYIPLSKELLKLDPVRLPQDGRVPIYRPADMVLIHHTDSEQLAAPLSAGQTVNLSRGPISKLWLHDENGVPIPPAMYTANLATTPATITFADPLDLSAYQQPLVATHRIEQQRLVEDAQINGTLKLFTKITANFPADETYVSTLVQFDDLQARVAYLFTQKVWGNLWSNERIGDDSLASYNDVIYPIEVLNRNAITERWAVVFESTNTFYVLGEFSGVIATGSIAADCAPINPYTGEPYFILRKEGWGSGWVPNNVLRFNTVGAYAPVWVIRTTQAGEAVVTQDQGTVEIRGDAD